MTRIEEIKNRAEKAIQPTESLLRSMAFRNRHDFGLLPEAIQQVTLSTMRQLWEEVAGIGFYQGEGTLIAALSKVEAAEKLLEGYDLALRQWRMYAENDERDLDTDSSLEGEMYRFRREALAAYRKTPGE